MGIVGISCAAASLPEQPRASLPRNRFSFFLLFFPRALPVVVVCAEYECNQDRHLAVLGNHRAA